MGFKCWWPRGHKWVTLKEISGVVTIRRMLKSDTWEASALAKIQRCNRCKIYRGRLETYDREITVNAKVLATDMSTTLDDIVKKYNGDTT